VHGLLGCGVGGNAQELTNLVIHGWGDGDKVKRRRSGGKNEWVEKKKKTADVIEFLLFFFFVLFFLEHRRESWHPAKDTGRMKGAGGQVVSLKVMGFFVCLFVAGFAPRERSPKKISFLTPAKSLDNSSRPSVLPAIQRSLHTEQ